MKNVEKVFGSQVYNSPFKRGDKVRVLRKVATRSNGWDNSWEPEMDPAVGKVGTVVVSHGTMKDVSVDIPGIGQYGYPSFALELVPETPIQAAPTTFKTGDQVHVNYPEYPAWNGDGVVEGTGWSPDIFVIRFNRAGYFDKGGFNSKYITLLPIAQIAEPATSTKQGPALSVARNLAMSLAKQNPYKKVTIDWVQDELAKQGYTSADLGNAAGSIFRGPFRNTGTTVKSLRAGNRKRRITVWEYTGA